MSKSKFKLTKGLAQHIVTGEPLFITSIDGDQATTCRAKMAQSGLEYITETFPCDQLETRYNAAQRVIEFEMFLDELRAEASEKRYSLDKLQLGALKQMAANVDNPSKGSDA